jgi:hypothetical protein
VSRQNRYGIFLPVAAQKYGSRDRRWDIEGNAYFCYTTGQSSAIIVQNKNVQ